MAKGGGGTETVKTESEPWPGQQPYLTDVMGEARNLYDQGFGQQYAPFSTVVPYHGSTLEGLNQTRDLAQQGNPFVQPSVAATRNILQGGTSFGNRFANNSGGNPLIDPAASQATGQSSVPVDPRYNQGPTAAQGVGQTAMGRVASGFDQASASRIDPFTSRGITAGQGLMDRSRQGDPTQSFYQNVQQGGLRNQTSFQPFTQPGSTPAEQYLAGIAGGQAGQNPYIDQVIQNSADDIRNQIGSVFSSGGRYGSAAHQNALVDSIGEMASRRRMEAFEADRARQLQASGQIQSAFDASQGRALSATGQQAGLREADIGRQLLGAGALSNQFGQNFNRQLQASQLMGGFQGQDLARQLSAAQAATGVDQGNVAQRLQAGQALSSSGLQDRSLNLQQANSLSDVLNQNLQRQLQASGQLQQYDLGRQGQTLQGLAMAPAVRDSMFADAARLGQVGTAFENKAAQQINDRLARFRFGQQAPWDALGRYSGIVSGLGNLGGTSTQTGPSQSTNPLMGAIGGFSGAAGGLSALGSLGGAGAALASGPLAPFVLGAGALGGLFS
jgi:hypothetical protein